VAGDPANASPTHLLSPTAAVAGVSSAHDRSAASSSLTLAGMTLQDVVSKVVGAVHEEYSRKEAVYIKRVQRFIIIIFL
jgi:hypothetical protein